MVWRARQLLSLIAYRFESVLFATHDLQKNIWLQCFPPKSHCCPLVRWKEGKTGDPLVDANMRELAATGWMSNRGRQNVAAWLMKEQTDNDGTLQILC